MSDIEVRNQTFPILAVRSTHATSLQSRMDGVQQVRCKYGRDHSAGRNRGTSSSPSGSDRVYCRRDGIQPLIRAVRRGDLSRQTRRGSSALTPIQASRSTLPPASAVSISAIMRRVLRRISRAAASLVCFFLVAIKTLSSGTKSPRCVS